MNAIRSLKITFLNIEINNIKPFKYGENKLTINKLNIDAYSFEAKAKPLTSADWFSSD